MEAKFGYSFPAIRGVQAKREYYVTMCPLRLIPRMFLFDEVELVPEVRAQRNLNKARIPIIAQYILDNRNNYVFSALTASIDSQVKFEPFEDTDPTGRLGSLHVPMDAKFIINDGQHRRAAIEQALREKPELGDETIAVVFFLDIALERCQQMFADLNRYTIRPDTSLSILYDHRDEMSALAKIVSFKAKPFVSLVEMEKNRLSKRSRKLFTLSNIHNANKALIKGIKDLTLEEGADLAITFWEEVGKQLPEWKQVQEGKLKASEVRDDFIHTYGIILQAIGKIGNELLKDTTSGLFKGANTDWKKVIRKLKKIDFSRSNTDLWEGRSMIGGKISKARVNIILTTTAIKQHLDLPLSAEEKRTENSFMKGK